MVPLLKLGVTVLLASASVVGVSADNNHLQARQAVSEPAPAATGAPAAAAPPVASTPAAAPPVATPAPAPPAVTSVAPAPIVPPVATSAAPVVPVLPTTSVVVSTAVPVVVSSTPIPVAASTSIRDSITATTTSRVRGTPIPTLVTSSSAHSTATATNANIIAPNKDPINEEYSSFSQTAIVGISVAAAAIVVAAVSIFVFRKIANGRSRNAKNAAIAQAAAPNMRTNTRSGNNGKGGVTSHANSQSTLVGRPSVTDVHGGQPGSAIEHPSFGRIKPDGPGIHEPAASLHHEYYHQPSSQVINVAPSPTGRMIPEGYYYDPYAYPHSTEMMASVAAVASIPHPHPHPHPQPHHYQQPMYYEVDPSTMSMPRPPPQHMAGIPIPHGHYPHNEVYEAYYPQQPYQRATYHTHDVGTLSRQPSLEEMYHPGSEDETR